MIKPKNSRLNRADQIKEMSSKEWRYLVYKAGEVTLSFCICDHRIMDVIYQDENKLQVGNIYLGRITKVSKNIGSVFVDTGNHTSCFLALNDIKNPILTNRVYDGRIVESDQIVVQITKEAYKNKLACATTKLELAGDYCVLNNSIGTFSFSKKATENEKESLMKSLADNKNDFNSDESVLFRTKALKTENYEEVFEELKYLREQMQQVENTAMHQKNIGLLFQNSGLYENVIQRCLNQGGKIITKDEEILQRFMQIFEYYHMDSKEYLNFYQDESISMNSLYGLSGMLQQITEEKVWLKSGANIYITPTEALTVIDVNTAKSQQNQMREETLLAINLEAAKEIAYQIRARSLGGIIIVDFINMKEPENITILLTTLEQALNELKPAAKLVDVTKLGLVEITRKKETTDIYQKMTFIDKTILL